MKDAMNDNAGEQRSGAEVSVSSNEETVTLTRLNPATSYNFYAVLQRPPLRQYRRTLSQTNDNHHQNIRSYGDRHHRHHRPLCCHQ